MKEEGSSEVVELSVEATNKLRKELGLAPLREKSASKDLKDGGPVPPVSTATSVADTADDAVLEMSVDETNQLRASLGLSPLRSNKKEPQYVNPAEAVEAQKAKERLEAAKLKRTVEQGYQEFDSALASQPAEAASSWAKQMLQGETEISNAEPLRKKKKAKRENKETKAEYDASDLNGLTVAHSLKDFSGDSTTILTLQDASLINKDALNEDDVQLENINLAEARKVADGLREKRKVEMGMGQTNGYAGYDDDEFEELGGTQGPSRMSRGQVGGGEEKAVRVKGFRIGSMTDDREEGDDTSNPFFRNKAISLETRADVIAADFMTTEEDEKLRQKKKKDKKFKKSKKKKERKHNKRPISMDEESEDDQQPQTSLLDALESSAVGVKKEDDLTPAPSSATGSKPSVLDKRDRYNAIMAKGNQRARKAFEPIRSTPDPTYMDEEPDDAFLNQALAKARRLKKLQDMQRGALAVTSSLKQHANMPEVVESGETTIFETDETSEFTRALRARSTQTKRIAAKKKVKTEDGAEQPIKNVVVEDVEMTDAGDEKLDLRELSKDIKEDPLPNNHQNSRGVGSILEMLKGDLSQKHAGREALRGRAKDERTYEDYAPLNLSEVVKIDERNATKLDKELANREVKLEYRDKHGRLLTRKEAYRELCYQFHGHGSGKRKEQKKLEQISREQAEARLVQESATMGALQATQKATGKAYVVHKSGKS